jgi:hypothetical protein
MISYNLLGSNGRIGNQMFQYATLLGIAEKHGYEFCIPSSNFNDPFYDHQLLEVFELKNLKKGNIKKLHNVNQIKESSFRFDSTLFETCPDNVDIFGYFQTEKYFLHCVDKVKEDFTFKEEILNDANDYRNQLKSNDVISIHIRRGDYLKYPWHGCCPLEYYEKALSLIDDNIPVIIFSDDPEWCLQQKIFESDRFYVSENNTNAFDLCLMSMCNYHIISNSSFSWWGAWLANSKYVYAPNRWFGSPLSEQNDTSDLIPEGWIKL